MSMKRCTLWISGVGVLALLSVLTAAERAGFASPQKPAPPVNTVPCSDIVSVEGGDSFAAYCAVCHGADAKGAGPAAAAMKAPVPDLTTIAKRHGQFDSVKVQYAIMGSDRLSMAAHGTTTMPVWGQVLKEAGGQDRTTLRVQNLVNYLKSLQVQ